MLKLRNKKQGFSLIELLVTVSIIGILAAVAVPAYNTYKEDAKIGVLQTTTNVVAGALRTCLALKDATDCNTVTKIQVKNEGGKIAIGSVVNSVVGTAQSKSSSPADSNIICYDIKSAGTFDGKANGCVDSAGTQAFCKWGSDNTATSGADCADGVCRIASTNTNECE